ncbi:hypothetical protein [Microcoleus sp. Pol12B4]|uniref:hypothetical protein n=1 Tax=Microcoleus sp. Pol12B4 TaxID=3055395 RepID=UPI002FD617F5
MTRNQGAALPFPYKSAIITSDPVDFTRYPKLGNPCAVSLPLTGQSLYPIARLPRTSQDYDGVFLYNYHTEDKLFLTLKHDRQK